MAISIPTSVETHQGLFLIQLGDLGVGCSRVLYNCCYINRAGGLDLMRGPIDNFKCLVEGAHVPRVKMLFHFL